MGGAVAQRRGKPVRAANQEGDVGGSGVAPLAQSSCEGFARLDAAAFVERNDEGSFRHGGGEKGRFAFHEFRRVAAAFFLHFGDGQRRDANAAPGRVETRHVVVEKEFFGACLQPPHGTYLDAHKSPSGMAPAISGRGEKGRAESEGSVASNGHLVCRNIGGPHLLQPVELAHFGAEDMDHHVAAIDEHPVALFHSLDL